MKSTKKQLGLSFLSLLLCVSMLIGTTFAWFTDSVSSGISRIIAGNLDVEMYWAEHFDGPWYNAEDPEHAILFGEDELWEPGYTSVRYIKIVNAGSLALKYRLGVEAAGEVGALADVIDVKYIPEGMAAGLETRSDFSALPTFGNLRTVLAGFTNSSENAPTGMILPAGETSGGDAFVGETVCALALHMQEEAGNEYKKASVGAGFYVTVTATQIEYESDSFDSYYDEDLSFPALNLPKSISAPVELDDNCEVKEETSLQGEGDVSAVVPAGTKLEEGTTQAVLTVTKVSSNGNISASDTVISQTLDVHLDGVAADNDKPILVTVQHALPANMNSGAIALYHKEGDSQNLMTGKSSADAVTEHNDYYYNSTTGDVIMALAHFSEIEFQLDTANSWNGGVADGFASGSGTEDDPYLINTVDQLAYFSETVNEGIDYNGEFVKLGANLAINTWDIPGTAESDYKGEYTAKKLGENNNPAFEQNGKLYKYFAPIGHGSNLSNETAAGDLAPFRGTFDGGNHTVSGLFNLWYDDPAEWSKQIGLFGCIENATIKNLTVADSFIYTYGGMVGLVASFAGGNSTFENIKVQFNYATAYNNYLGGVVGCVFDHDSTNANVTFKNVTVDNTNKLEALWGTYDAPVGGVVGASYPNSDVTFESVTVSPEMSLYNDCCANYQWFAYRYSGMLIGYVRSGARADYLANKVHCTDVTVKYGDWTDQYYCELMSAGKGSYNGEHEWKYVRISKDQVVRDANGNIIGCTVHDHAANNVASGCAEDEDHIAMNLTFKQLFGGGQGVYGEEEHTGVTVACEGQLFESKFVNSDKYLYRVGNMDGAPLSAIFRLKDGVTLSSGDHVKVTVTPANDSFTASGTCSGEADWTKRTLSFEGTGLVNINITSRGMTTTQLVEVIDARNAVNLVNAEECDVVLLSNVGLGNGSRFTVSNGHTLFGNGFKISTSFAGYGLKGRMADAFVELTNGNLIDTQVVSSIYPRGYLYNTSTSFGEALEDSNNLNTTIGSGKDYYFYQYNAVKISGKCSISNCYIEGARNNILVTDGMDGSVIENTTLAYGALANMYVGASSGTLILRDVTTVQDVKITNLPASELNKDDNHKNDDQKTVFGMGILVGNDETPSYPTLKFEGHFTQHNWIKKGTKVTSNITNMLINAVFNGNQEYMHTIGGETYANIGVVYMSSNTVNINTDSFADKANYKLGNVSMSGVGTGQTYSFTGNADSVAIPEYSYTANEQETRADYTKLVYKGSGNYTVNEAYDNENKALIPTISVEIEEGESAALAVKDIAASRSGICYTPATFKVNGTAVSNDYAINCSTSDQFVIECSGTTDGYYDASGEFISNEQSYTLLFKFNVVSKSIDPPQFVNTDNYSKSTHWVSGWTIATTPIENIDLRYFSQSRGCYVTVPLSVFTPSANGKSSNGGTTWTGTYDGCTLTLSAPDDIKTNYKGAFYTSNGTMYYTLSNSSGYSNTTAGSTRQAKVSITVTDANSKSATFSQKLVATYNDSATKLSDSWSTITGGKTTKYIVRLDAGGGTVSSAASSALTSGNSFMLPTPIRDGFGFDGWFDQPTDGTLIGMGNATYKTTKANVVLYAHWHSLSPRTLAFNANGGNCDSASETYIGGTMQTLPNVTRNGYWCTGWWTAASGGEKVGESGGSYKHPETDGVTYYAQWSPVYTVTYNANGGIVSPASAKYEGTALTLPTPTTADSSKAFVGWYSGDKEITSPYTPTANVTLTAKWNTKVTVSYDTNGGSTAPASQTIGQGAPITLAAAPARTGYTFNGWSDGTDTYDAGASYTVNATVTLTAQWTAIQYKITLDQDGGSGANLNKATYTISNAAQTVSIAGNSTRNSYTFDKWSISANSSGVTSSLSGTTLTIPAGAYGNITIKADWKSESGGGCVTPETLITMADGSQKPICEVKSGDMLLAWDFFNGKYVTAPVVFNDGEREAMCEVIRCIFTDGTEVDVISEHGFFDMTNGEFVYLDSNASKYIGHSFMKQDGTTVELADVIIEERMTTAFDTNTYQHLCFYNNGMLSISGGISGMFNIFDVDTKTMKYDEAKMQADIEAYGLLDIDAFGGMITEDMFNAFNGKYLGIAVGKGNLTWEYIAYLAERYAPLCK